MMTKDDELALLDTFVAGLPDGYLRDILTDGRPAIERDIRNDMTAGTLSHLENLRRQASDDLAAVRKQLQAAQDELSRTMRQVNRANDALAELRTDAKRIAATV